PRMDLPEEYARGPRPAHEYASASGCWRGSNENPGERLNSRQRAAPKALRKLALSFNNAGQPRISVDYTKEGHTPEMDVEREKILVVDDEEAIREVVSTLLDAQGYLCTVCANELLALEAFQNDSFDLV